MRFVHQPVVGDGLPDHAPFGRRCRRQRLCEQRQRARPRHAEEARQNQGAAAIGNQADAREGLDEARRLRRQHDIAGQRQIGAGAGGDAVDGADHRQRQGAQLADQRIVVVEQVPDLSRRQVDNRVQILPGAEAAPGAGDQFTPEFLKITPNHRIPAIVDPDGPGGKPFTLFESAAIMIYLSEKTGGRLIPKDPIGRYKCLEWMMFQMGGVGPMFGQWNHFGAYAPQKIPYAIERYTNETKRLTRVLNRRLEETEWLAGDEYSMADIIIFPWIRTAAQSGVRFAERGSIDVNEYPAVKRWYDEIAARPAVQRGLAILADHQSDRQISDTERENTFCETHFAARCLPRC